VRVVPQLEPFDLLLVKADVIHRTEDTNIYRVSMRFDLMGKVTETFGQFIRRIGGDRKRALWVTGYMGKCSFLGLIFGTISFFRRWCGQGAGKGQCSICGAMDHYRTGCPHTFTGY